MKLQKTGSLGLPSALAALRADWEAWAEAQDPAKLREALQERQEREEAAAAVEAPRAITTNAGLAEARSSRAARRSARDAAVVQPPDSGQEEPDAGQRGAARELRALEREDKPSANKSECDLHVGDIVKARHQCLLPS